MKQRRFKSGNYPVAERRHLLEAGTEWLSYTGQHRVRLVALHAGGEITLARLRPKGDERLPYAARIAVTSFLRNYKREDEE